ncbi:MAG: DivIVA domain-containing protein [Acidimicrobiales bacterium]
MDNNPATQSILDTLRTVEFRLGLKGYNVDEVDEYLEKAAVEAEAVKEQVRSAGDRLRQASERIGQLEAALAQAPEERSADVSARSGTSGDDETLQRTLVLAQKFVDQIKRESESEASHVVAKAEEHARAMVAQAEEHARRVTSEADERLREEVARLEAMRTRLAGEVDAMSKHMDAQRTRIRASLADALQWFDDHVQPPTARPDGSRPADDGSQGDSSGARSEQSGDAHESAVSSPTQLTPVVVPATQSAPAAPEPARADSTQVLPMTPPVSDRSPASAGAQFGAVGMTGNLFENGRRTE